MAAKVLQSIKKPFKGYQAKEIELQGKLLAKENKITRLAENNFARLNNLKELTLVLNFIGTCLKLHCDAEFRCTIQRPRQNLEKRLMVRCSSCGCRHMYDFEKEAFVTAPPSGKSYQ
ncbi:hypothetical protein RRF57_004530 [Xylaria bambusicola]|uniref:Uncharacterized protein n=1 Tax=Xylaria bambusicola TaxID=326684 RepID=A0AAN7UAD6_9PEZI